MNIFKKLISLIKKGDKFQSLKVGDIVISTENKYGFHMCKINRIYIRKRNYNSEQKYCRIEFEVWGEIKMVNVTYKSCKKL